MSGQKSNKHRQKSQKILGHWRNRAANWLVHKIYGKKMYISPYEGSLVAATVVFWYHDEGIRKCLMIREVGSNNSQLLFPGCLNSGQDKSPSQMLHQAVAHLLGPNFANTLDKELLEEDRVVAAPTLSMYDQTTQGDTPVQGVVWLVQITKQQAQLCISQNSRFEVLAIPAFSITAQKVDPAHKVVYQSIQRHLNQDTLLTRTSNALDDLLDTFHATPKRIH